MPNQENSTPRIGIRPTFQSQSVEILRDLVLSGRLPSGSRLNEVDLAQSLGISRGPLREAVRELVAEGLLVSVPGRGAFVKAFSADELTHLYGLRAALETYALRSLERRVDTSQLRKVAARARTLTDGGTPDYGADMQFHTALVTLTANPFLIDAAREAHQLIILAGSAYGYDSRRAHLAADEHERILAALDAGATADAVGLLEAHLTATLARALEAMRAPRAVDAP